MSRLVDMPCVGRPFEVGMPYDIKNDELTFDLMWNSDTIQKYLQTEQRSDTLFEVIACDSFVDKASKLTIPPELQLSIAVGLVKVSGSACYLLNYKQSKNLAQVTLRCRAISKFDHLALTGNLAVFQGEQISDNNAATHVVMKVIYGCELFIVFDRPVNRSEKSQVVQLNLFSKVNKLAEICKGSEDTAVEEVSFNDDKITCQFHGDFTMPTTPTTFKEVIKVCKELSAMLSKQSKLNPVPLQATLFPLARYDNRACQVVAQISDTHGTQIHRIMENLHVIKAQCNDFDHIEIVSKFNQLSSQIGAFTMILSDYEARTLKQLTSWLPRIRDGTALENELEALLKQNLNACLSSFSAWITKKVKEVNTLEGIMRNLQQFEFVPSPDLSELVYSGEYEQVCCFAINVTRKVDEFIPNVREYLGSKEKFEAFGEFSPCSWTENRTLMKKLMILIKQFKALHVYSGSNNIKYVVTDCSETFDNNEMDEPAILIYKDGIPEIFEPPSQPGKPIISLVTHNSLQIEWAKPEENYSTVISYTILYRSTRDSSDVNDWNEERTAGVEERFVMNNLRPNTSYMFKIRPESEIGSGLESIVSNPVTTKSAMIPSSPGQPAASKISSNGLSLTWSKPKLNYETVTTYTVYYRSATSTPDAGWEKVTTHEVKECLDINGLHPNVPYIFKVCAEYNSGSGPVGEVSEPIFLLPSKPSQPVASSISSDSIQLEWEKPELNFEAISSYTILYRSTGDPPNQWKEEITNGPQETITLSDLKERAHYIFKVIPHSLMGTGEESITSDPIQTKLLLPSEPGKPRSGIVTHEAIQLEWTKPILGAHNISSYTLLYCSLSDPQPDQWKEINTMSTETICTVGSLACKTQYIFKVRAESEDGPGKTSECCFPIETKPAIPGKVIGKPIISNVTHESVDISWGESEYGNTLITQYTILCRPVPDSDDHQQDVWPQVVHLRSNRLRNTVITGLNANTVYVFKIRPESNNGSGPESDVSDPVQTKESLATRIQSQSQLTDVGPPRIYKLSKREVVKNADDTKMIAKFQIGEPNPLQADNEKVLMVVGATGAGKSTLINGIVNYILGVRWEDGFRFKLITDESSKSQAHSQTSWITAYTLYPMEGSRVPYTVTLVDTPGFGDTRGIDRDRLIVSQIKEFFSVKGKNGIDQVHGIGFVTQASNARLTPTQKYIFDSILAVFGKDIASSIFMMTTFSDGQDPPVLGAIKEAGIPFRDSFKFNNSALYAKPAATGFDKMFWELGIESFKTFFIEFEKAQPQSLQLTREVLHERQRLETVVNGLQPQLNAGLNKIDELRQEEIVLKQQEAALLANKDFKYQVKITKQRKEDLPRGTYVTNCLTCNFTCHFPCAIAKDDEKYGCAAMDRSGKHDAKCTVCPGSCHWTQHVNNPYRFELYQEMETRTSADLKRRFDTAMKGKSQKERMIANMEKELESMHNEVLEMIQTAQGSLQRLQAIALKPNPLTSVEYIDLLIESEKREKSPGFLERIKAFEDIRERALLLEKLKKQGTITADVAKRKKDKTWWHIWWPGKWGK